MDHVRAAGLAGDGDVYGGVAEDLLAEPRLGFLAQARVLEDAIAAGKIAAGKMAATNTLIFNDRLDAVVCGVLMILVAITILDSVRVWYGILRGSRSSRTSETPFVLSSFEVEGA